MAKKKKKSKTKKNGLLSKAKESYSNLQNVQHVITDLKWSLTDWWYWSGKHFALGGSLGFIVGVIVDHFLIK